MSIKKYNWKEIQSYYNQGNSYRDVIEKYGCSMASLTRARNRGDLITRSKSEAKKIADKKHPCKHSEETKEKISAARKKYLTENPHMVPYKLNHKSKGPSYPEKYFKQLFKKEGINLVDQYQLGTYTLDFADIINKIDIEIDGSQHKYDSKIVEHDKKRTKWLKSKGWKVIRIYWPEWKKMSDEQKSDIVDSLRSNVSIKEIEDKLLEIKEENTNRCPVCNKEIRKQSKMCKACFAQSRKGLKVDNKITVYPERLHLRKVKNRPSKEELKKMIDAISWVAIGKKYGVSDNAVRKWARKYELI